MKQETQIQLKEFFKICYARLEKGEGERGERYDHLDLFNEITEELADISNYAFLQYLKMSRLRRKFEEMSSKSRNSF